MHLLEALRLATQDIPTEIQRSKLFAHMGNRGVYRERVIDRFLRPFIPKNVGLGSGEAFASTGAASRQLDVVLYDDVFSLVLNLGGRDFLFPCESVYGVIEVKSDLDGDEFKIAMENIASLKRLPREQAANFQPLPYCGIDPDPAGCVRVAGELGNPYLGVVFAYDSIKMDYAMKLLKDLRAELHYDDNLLPDYVFSFEQGFMITKVASRPGSFALHNPSVSAKWAAIDLGKDTIPVFFLLVNAAVTQIRLRGRRMARDAEELLNEIPRPRLLG